MKNIYDTLEFNQIKDKVKAFGVSLLAKDKIDSLAPYQDLEDLKLEEWQLRVRFLVLQQLILL